MSIAIVGKGKVNSLLADELRENGLVPYIFENAVQIKKISGEIGNFSIVTDTGSVGVKGIIVTEEIGSPVCLSGDWPYIKLSELDPETSMGNVSGTVAFILDYPFESNTKDTGIALEKAVILAKKKKKVLYLSRFMRTAANEFESLYREARAAGVTFIKYNSIEVDYNEESDVFSINIDDAYDSLNIQTREVIIAEGSVPQEGFNRVAKALRLKFDENGFVNSDKFYLYPTITNRKGIYYLNMNSAGSHDDLMFHIKYTISEIKKDEKPVQSGNSEIIEKYADVDPGKCAFCYTCFRACPHAAMVPDYENSVMKNLNYSCSACGICVSVCPANAVRIVNKEESLQQPEPKSLKVFCCENSGEIAVKRLEEEMDGLYQNVVLQPVSCGGELSTEIIIKALDQFDKVLVLTCMEGACRHFEGSKRAARFVDRAREMMKAAGLDEERIQYMQVSHAMKNVAGDYIKDMS
ncbi:MAG: hydrogenase iron-sulfur subunit [Acetivibrionales bacterium]|jgi:coenzyme F420-reducing hydrogenase delta subunit/Pyruvate/2-oxoacid:ferredoxin oxidoreductase delta subunit